MAERMVRRLLASGVKNKFQPGRPKGLLDLSVSICVRLEIIAILSGFLSRPGNVSGDQL
jgi:hypothetical protein